MSKWFTVNMVRSIKPIRLLQPMRCVNVWVDDETDETVIEDLVVLGAVVVVLDQYTRVRGLDQYQPETSPVHREMIKGGWSFEYRHEVFDLLVWSSEYDCPMRLHDALGWSDCPPLMGPQSMSAEHWDARIAAAADGIRRRRKTSPAGG